MRYALPLMFAFAALPARADDMNLLDQDLHQVPSGSIMSLNRTLDARVRDTVNATDSGMVCDGMADHTAA